MKKSYVFTIVALLALVICGLYFNDPYIKWTKGNAESEKDSNTVSTKVKEPTIANDTTQPPDSVQIVQQSNNRDISSTTESINVGNNTEKSNAESSSQTTIIHGNVKYNIQHVDHADHIGDGGNNSDN